MTARQVYFENYGCASNKFDLEIIIAFFQNAKYHIVTNLLDADVLVINTCGVKKPTEDKILHRLRILSNLQKPLIIAGCLPKINLKAIKQAIPKHSAIINSNSVNMIPFILETIDRLEKNTIFLLEIHTNKLRYPKVRLNKIIEIVQVAEGCLGFCAFCCTRLARGRLISYPVKSILRKVIKAVNEGVKEVWLTGQDTGAYGFDLGSNLCDLLMAVCKVKGDFFVRVGMMNPEHAINIKENLIRAFEDDRVFKFLHLPLQSGNDDVLQLMNRSYTTQDFINIIKKFRERIPEITIATDMICGFPGETNKSFEDSLKIIAEIKPDIVNISKFSPRPRTLAKKMKPLPSHIIKARSRKMTKLCRKISYEVNEQRLGWVGEVLIDEKGTKGKNSWIGRNFTYKPIVIKSSKKLLGKKIRVRITRAFPTYLQGERIDNS